VNPVAQAQAQSLQSAERRYTPSGLLYADLEIGMPLTGRNNLAEGPLLQRLGDLRWGHISHLCGVPSKQILDAEGHRLYPTFFYVETAFPRTRPMASFGENDRLKVASDLQRFGASMLDGTFYLLPEDYPESSSLSFDRVDTAVAAGMPAVRFSNIFVMQFSGAEWLKKSRPANPGFERIREMPEAPNSYALVKQAEKAGYFSLPPAGFVPMTDGVMKRAYNLVPDRDLNGAGLVYFANYPLFLDVCEREVLAAADLPLTDELIDRRTLVRRQSAYLNNASARDVLSVEIEAFVENPFASQNPAPEMAPIRLFINYNMYRQSDGRLMMVSTAEKVIFSRAMEDAPFFSKLEDLQTH
jgi:probable biosynthetic protein (TIGR04098 family)